MNFDVEKSWKYMLIKPQFFWLFFHLKNESWTHQFCCDKILMKERGALVLGLKKRTERSLVNRIFKRGFYGFFSRLSEFPSTKMSDNISYSISLEGTKVKRGAFKSHCKIKTMVMWGCYHVVHEVSHFHIHNVPEIIQISLSSACQHVGEEKYWHFWCTCIRRTRLGFTIQILVLYVV